MTAKFVYELTSIEVEASIMGRDLCVQIQGGDCPHIGSISIAEPRLSLDGSGRGAATVSNYNHVAHKDYYISDPVADRLAARLGCRVVVVCGVHYDVLHDEMLERVMSLPDEIARDIADWYCTVSDNGNVS